MRSVLKAGRLGAAASSSDELWHTCAFNDPCPRLPKVEMVYRSSMGYFKENESEKARSNNDLLTLGAAKDARHF